VVISPPHQYRHLCSIWRRRSPNPHSPIPSSLFCIAGPRIWNRLRHELRVNAQCNTLSCFNSNLKTHYFRRHIDNKHLVWSRLRLSFRTKFARAEYFLTGLTDNWYTQNSYRLKGKVVSYSLLMSFKIIEIGTNLKHMRLPISLIMPIFCRLRDKTISWSKICVSCHPCLVWNPHKGVPVGPMKFGIKNYRRWKPRD